MLISLHWACEGPNNIAVSEFFLLTNLSALFVKLQFQMSLACPPGSWSPHDKKARDEFPFDLASGFPSVCGVPLRFLTRTRHPRPF